MDAKQMAEPRLIERAHGDWLAVSPEGCAIKIGVIAASQDEAVAAFGETMAQWERALSKRHDVPESDLTDA